MTEYLLGEVRSNNLWFLYWISYWDSWDGEGRNFAAFKQYFSTGGFETTRKAYADIYDTYTHGKVLITEVLLELGNTYLGGSLGFIAVYCRSGGMDTCHKCSL